MTRAAKRFYKTAEVAATPDGFSVTLDGRPVKTPVGSLLIMATEDLAAAVAEEWLAQQETIKPHTMPVTQLAATSLDRVAPRRGEVVDQAISYASTDLVCYRAEEPPDLIQRQEAHWQPLLEWVFELCGARLRVTSGVIPLKQPDHALDNLRDLIDRFTDEELTALVTAMQASGSLVVALALICGRVDADTAFAASQLDESYQMERWGEDKEAADRRRRVLEEVRVAAAFLELARSSTGETPRGETPKEETP